jgi:hypothetical protein
MAIMTSSLAVGSGFVQWKVVVAPWACSPAG